MTEGNLRNLISAMRFSDSLFPSGAFGFSWGMEALWDKGWLTSGNLQRVVQSELEGRWALSDRVFILRAVAASDLNALHIIDNEAHLLAWPQSLREGACRAGLALLRTHVRLETPGAINIQKAVREGSLKGHLPVMQGAISGCLEFEPELAVAMAGYSFLSGLGSVAIRLGWAGAIEVQEVLAAITPRLVELCKEPPPVKPTSFSPIFDIAMMNKGTKPLGLFAN